MPPMPARAGLRARPRHRRAVARRGDALHRARGARRRHADDRHRRRRHSGDLRRRLACPRPAGRRASSARQDGARRSPTPPPIAALMPRWRRTARPASAPPSWPPSIEKAYFARARGAEQASAAPASARAFAISRPSRCCFKGFLAALLLVHIGKPCGRAPMNEIDPAAPLLGRRGPQARRSCRRRQRPTPALEQGRPAGRRAIPARHDVAGHGQRRAAPRRVRACCSCRASRSTCIYVGFATHLVWQYPAIIVGASLLDRRCCSNSPTATRSPRCCGRSAISAASLLVWTGTLRAAGADRLLHEDVERLFAPAGSAAGSSAASCCCSACGWSCRRLIRRWARNGSMERRAVIVGGGKAAEAADPLGRAAALQRHPHLRHLRRPRRQALAADRRRLSRSSAPSPN